MPNKTQPTKTSVNAFLNAVPDEQRRKDAKAVAKLMQEVTGEKPVLWGPSIVGFGKARYKYESGREGDWPLAAFSPRKDSLTVYLMSGYQKDKALMETLGKYKTGKSCLYIKRLADVDQRVLERLIAKSVKSARSGDWSY